MPTYSDQILDQAFTLDHGLIAKDTTAKLTKKSTVQKHGETPDETAEA